MLKSPFRTGGAATNRRRAVGRKPSYSRRGEGCLPERFTSILEAATREGSERPPGWSSELETFTTIERQCRGDLRATTAPRLRRAVLSEVFLVDGKSPGSRARKLLSLLGLHIANHGDHAASPLGPAGHRRALAEPRSPADGQMTRRMEALARIRPRGGYRGCSPPLRRQEGGSVACGWIVPTSAVEDVGKTWQRPGRSALQRRRLAAIRSGSWLGRG